MAYSFNQKMKVPMSKKIGVPMSESKMYEKIRRDNIGFLFYKGSHTGENGETVHRLARFAKTPKSGGNYFLDEEVFPCVENKVGW